VENFGRVGDVVLHSELNELVGELFAKLSCQDRAVAQLELIERHAMGIAQAARKLKTLILGVDHYGQDVA
jgi:hypothetical protein